MSIIYLFIFALKFKNWWSYHKIPEMSEPKFRFGYFKENYDNFTILLLTKLKFCINMLYFIFKSNSILIYYTVHLRKHTFFKFYIVMESHLSQREFEGYVAQPRPDETQTCMLLVSSKK